MNGSLGTILLVLGYVAAGAWLLLTLARFQKAWERSQSDTASLRYSLTVAARQLMRNIEEVKKLDSEIKAAEESAAAVVRDQERRRAAAAATPLPPPEEIHVLAEFPASRKDIAWVAEFARGEDEPPVQPWERVPQSTLFWAINQAAAMARARQIVSDYKGFEVKAARRFAPPDEAV